MGSISREDPELYKEMIRRAKNETGCRIGDDIAKKVVDGVLEIQGKLPPEQSPCNICPFTPTVAAVLALMGRDWLSVEEHRMDKHIGAILRYKGEVPETSKEAYRLISNLKEMLETEMRGGKSKRNSDKL